MECKNYCKLHKTEFCKEYKSKTTSIYDMDQWRKDQNFKAEVMQQVTDEVVENFRDSVYPEILKNDYILTGEPYTHGKARNGKVTPYYISFTKHGKKWYYTGLQNIYKELLQGRICIV